MKETKKKRVSIFQHFETFDKETETNHASQRPNLHSSTFSPDKVHLEPTKRSRTALTSIVSSGEAKLLNHRRGSPVQRLSPPPHPRRPKPGPPQLRLRGGGVPAAGHGEDRGGAAAHGRDAVGGEREDAAAGGVREGDGRRSVQRDHMGRGG